jgi:nucleolar protein 15
LPPHFEEHELVQFLKQFGKVLNLRVSRSKTTGNSKGFAFVQMQSAGIAAIVADTLAGYIMFGQRRLVCHVVPPDKIHKKLFFRQKRIVKKAPVTEKALGKMKEITSRLVARDRKKRDTLKALGIDYDFPGYVASKKEEKEVAPTKKSAKSTRSTESPDNKQPKKKQRKDSVASVESPATSDSKKGKKRKESLTSVVAAEKTDKEAEAVQKSTRSNSPKSTENKQPKKKMRKDSDEAVVDAKKQESKSKIKSPPAAKGKAAKPAAAQSEKKKAVSKPRTRRSL